MENNYKILETVGTSKIVVYLNLSCIIISINKNTVA